jgi:hypothetical protein
MNKEVKKLGRPVVEGSKRQLELKLKAELREKGLVKRGRPVNEESKRQNELKRKSELKEQGILNGLKGRPVNKESKRQQVLALKESGLRAKPGRPKVKKDEVEEVGS